MKTQVWKLGEPLSPLFPTIETAARWAEANGYAKIEMKTAPHNPRQPMTAITLALDVEIKHVPG